MNRTLRILSRLFDYSILFIGISLLFDFFYLPLTVYVTAILTLPLLFIPFETLSLKLFGTTLGKILCGFRYIRKTSLKESFGLALKKALLIQPLFLPGINLFFIYFYIRELHQHKSNRWDRMDSIELIKKPLNKIAYSGLLFFTFILSAFSFFPTTTLHYTNKILHTELSSPLKDGLLPSDEWVKLTPKNNSFTILFPHEPSFKEEHHDVPNSSTKLTTHEYTYTSGKHTYSLSFVTLPKRWTMWGSNPVLNASIDHIKEGHQLLSKKKSSHYQHSSMNYTLHLKNNNETLGKIVLVNNTVYRLELISKSTISHEDEELALKFFATFTPRS